MRRSPDKLVQLKGDAYVFSKEMGLGSLVLIGGGSLNCLPETGNDFANQCRPRPLSEQRSWDRR